MYHSLKEIESTLKKVIVVLCLTFLIPSYAHAQKPQSISINVKEYGAKGDGRTDDTKAIQMAINQAKQRGGTAYFPSGTYIVSQLNIQSSMIGSQGTTIMKKSINKLNKFIFCNIKDESGITISGITFDGSVILDKRNNPVAGSTPLFIYGSKNVSVINCRFQNSAQSGIRVEASMNIKLKNCQTENTNGQFGDGYYFEGCQHVLVQNCMANNYTRIGFVTEKNSTDFTFKNCLATNGHSASILTDGTEFNAGFWYENSANITTISCSTANNTHYGFVSTTGSEISKVITTSYATFTYTDCISTNSYLAFKNQSKSIPVHTSLTRCQALNTYQGFVGTAKCTKDIFIYNKCRVSLNPISQKAKNSAGFMWESPSTTNKPKTSSIPIFTYNNCFVAYQGNKQTILQRINNKANNNGDISTYSGGRAKIVVNNFNNSLQGENVKIKAIRGKPIYDIKNTDIDKNFIK